MADPHPSPPPLDYLLARGPHALFLDFDGTLVELAPTPDGIDVPADLARRLVALASRLEQRVALISGRGLDDLESHLGPLALACAGSHGADLRSAAGASFGTPASTLADAVLARIERFAADRGARYEAKAHGAALHSAGDSAVEQASADFLAELADTHGLALKRGKRVVELVHPGADKGRAVRAFMARAPFSGAVPVFVGDDVTDEDGFAAAHELGGLAIAVGPRESEHADFALADPAAVHQWLGL